MVIRRYKPDDCSALAELFYDTVHSVNLRDYTEAQVNAWATGTEDIDKWNASFLEHITVAAECGGCIAGFGDITENGYLDRQYVHKNYQKQGIAAAICDRLESNVKADRITTHASITARGFFEKRGYRVVKEQQVERHDGHCAHSAQADCLIDQSVNFV